MFDTFEFERKGISERAADYIKQFILDGKYKVNEKLPGEREMAINLKVSRNTVREAYKILEAYGYITIKHGTGIFVASEEYQISKMASFFFVSTDQLKDLFSIRRILENSAVEWAVKHATEDQMNELTEIVNKAKKETRGENDFQKLAELDQKFHLTLAHMSGNTVLIHVMHNLIDLLQESRIQSMQIPSRPVKSVDEHETIVQALQERNAQKAQDNMAVHLESVEKSIMESLSSSAEPEQ
ncbi:FadR/GntR family transcriptional regulator [Salibacterium qingdaonense]|uniref:Transcriptional regulator, GntR family n=1 Tax=Salibacterium qingdaonense TaxID=266892 RepID=A0A1I4NIV2_9BACI|nr:FadR/GntR family transcriptional regulator [Salibacterium qingdaonense]SFM15275.1 transcriptional regulator, GntR family [Salibacterium qingdaonense]